MRMLVRSYRVSEQLAAVGEANPVLLTRREPGEDEDRNDWLLLPPDHRPGQRHPLLVYFYPDKRYGKELKGDDLRDISFLNKNIPTARGYAVLMASMKISDYRSEEHTSELQSLMRISYAVFCLKKKKTNLTS